MNEAETFTDRVAPWGRFRLMANLFRGLKGFFSKPAPVPRLQVPPPARTARPVPSGGPAVTRPALKEPPVLREPFVAKEPAVVKEPWS
jgi:hypothetical protein